MLLQVTYNTSNGLEFQGDPGAFKNIAVYISRKFDLKKGKGFIVMNYRIIWHSYLIPLQELST